MQLWRELYLQGLRKINKYHFPTKDITRQNETGLSSPATSI
ncbi:unnamed protein product [Fusarium graminearum]|nr:unnamed protein product [Fusarium graminearum]